MCVLCVPRLHDGQKEELGKSVRPGLAKAEETLQRGIGLTANTAGPYTGGVVGVVSHPPPPTRKQCRLVPPSLK